MWWLIGSTPDQWCSGLGFESGISHNDSDAPQDHCVILYKNLSEKKFKKILKVDQAYQVQQFGTVLQII